MNSIKDFNYLESWHCEMPSNLLDALNSKNDISISPKTNVNILDMLPHLTDEEKASQTEYYRAFADENGRIELKSISDSTLYFLASMVHTLKEIGCTDIQSESREATADEIPKDKPWCSWVYIVSGILPKR